MDKKALINSGRLQFPKNDRTDKNFIAQPKINLQSFKSTPDSLKQRFKTFGRKPSLGAPEEIQTIQTASFVFNFIQHIVTPECLH